MFLSGLLLGISAVQAEPSVVFLGNSYTQFNNLPLITSSMLQQNVQAWESTEYVDLVSGGLTLKDHADRLNNPNSEWATVFEQTHDIYILQDQSQTPAFPQTTSYWQDSLNGLIEIQETIEAQDAMTMLFLTWGRRDGDAQNPSLFPDFETMQEALNDGYLTYADRASNNSQIYIAPIGPIFGEIKRQDTDLFQDLYSQDGSHPSQIGSATTALGMVASLTGRPISDIPTDLSSEQQEIINAAVEKVVLEDSVGVFPLPWVWSEVPEDGIVDDTMMRPLLVLEEDYSGILEVPDGRIWLQDGLFFGTAVLGENSEFRIDGGDFIGNIEGSVELYSGSLNPQDIAGDLRQSGGYLIIERDVTIEGDAILGDIEVLVERACLSASSINIDNMNVFYDAEWELSGSSGWETICFRAWLSNECDTEDLSDESSNEAQEESSEQENSTTQKSRCSSSGILILLPFLGFFRRRKTKTA